VPTNFCHLTGYDVVLSQEDRDVLVHYARRSLLIAGAEDRVILPGLPFPHEELAILNRLEVGPPPTHVSTQLNLLAHDATLEPFSGAAQRLWEIANSAHCYVDAPSYHVCVKANDKAWFQTRFGQDEAAKLPPGAVCPVALLEDAVTTLMKRHGRPVRLKDARSASGLNQHIFAFGAEIAFPQQMDATHEVVLQVEVPRHADASVQIEVDRNEHHFAIGPVIAQHIKGEGNHCGNFYPATLTLQTQPVIPPAIFRQMKASALVIAHGLAELDYFGPASVDYAVDLERGEAWALEVNARISAPRYPLRALEVWYGPGVIQPFDLRTFRFPKGMTATALAARFEGLLFRRADREGFIPFTIIPEHGVCVGVTFAKTPADLVAMVGEVESRKAQLL